MRALCRVYSSNNEIISLFYIKKKKDDLSHVGHNFKVQNTQINNKVNAYITACSVSALAVSV